MEWIANNWPIISAAAALLVSVINTITRHYSDHRGLVRVLLIVVEYLSFLTSKNAPTWLKWPLTSASPESGKGSGPSVMLWVSLVMLASCSTVTPRGSLAKALVLTEAVDTTVMEIFKKQCVDAAKSCGKNVFPADCIPFQKCSGNITQYEAASTVLKQQLAVVNRILERAGIK